MNKNGSQKFKCAVYRFSKFKKSDFFWYKQYQFFGNEYLALF